MVSFSFGYENSRRNTHVKQKKRDVDPTRKVVAADTGTYRLGRNGRGGEETAVPTPPPPPPLLKPGIRDRKRGDRRQTEKEIYSLSAMEGGGGSQVKWWI